VLDCFKTKIRKPQIKTMPDGREIAKTKAGWEKQRKAVHDRENGYCELCLGLAPLHNTEQAFAGHAHHLTTRKIKDGRPNNLMWLCGRCHSKLHIPTKVIPSKRA